MTLDNSHQATAPDVTDPGVAAKPADFPQVADQYRRELTAHCYRMTGSVYDAEDMVQETYLRAWRAYDDFEGRSTVRTWLYRIATNVCLDQLSGRQRRALPMDLSGSPWQPVEHSLAQRRPGTAWVEPMLDRQVIPEDADPAERIVMKESIRLAFVAALQHLPPRQRAVLILREVLRWKADEVAQLLETSVASVNSALQRARATLAATGGVPEQRDLDADDRELLARYVDAFERYDIDAIVALLHEDATQHMPPFEMWLRGSNDIATWMLGPGIGCRGSRVVATEANGSPAVAQWRPKEGGGFEPWALHVLETADGRVTHISSFLNLDNELFLRLGLPVDPDQR
jgi:RNA polymerase sigma-70 factor (ECF subfamily)